jgi:single-strand DNA-binding protein
MGEKKEQEQEVRYERARAEARACYPMQINTVVIGGYLVRDPDFRNVGTDLCVAEFSVAVNHTYTSNGEKKQGVDFISVIAWKRAAEICRDHLRKGSPVIVEGRLKQDRWQDSEGRKHSKTKVHAERVQLIGRKPEENNTGRAHE